jgi:hypothetical protein
MFWLWDIFENIITSRVLYYEFHRRQFIPKDILDMWKKSHRILSFSHAVWSKTLLLRTYGGLYQHQTANQK